jgi:hypothetical protein
MTSIVQLRKDQRAARVMQENHPWQIPSAHIPPFVLKILGLKSAK